MEIHQINSNKLFLYGKLAEYARKRTELTGAIIYSEDVFKQDELNQELESYAGKFSHLRTKLLDLPLSKKETLVLNQINSLVPIVLPSQREAVELSMDGDFEHRKQAQAMLYQIVYPGQGKIIEVFFKLSQIAIEDTQGMGTKYTSMNNQMNDTSRNILFWVLFIACLIALIVILKIQSIHTRLQNTVLRLKASENESISAQRMLETVLNAIPVRVFWKNIDLDYLGCNLPFAKDAGKQKPSDLIGLNDFDMSWKNEAEQYRKDDKIVIDKGKPLINYEERQTNSEGKEFWLQTSKIPLKDNNNKTIGILGVYEDITERKQIEINLKESEKAACATKLEAERASKAKSEFLSSMSHELRTPLNAILGFSQLLRMNQDNNLTKMQLENVDEISNAGTHLLYLVNEILDLSKIESGHMELFLETVSLKDVITKSLPLIIPLADKRGITIRVFKEDIEFDTQSLEQTDVIFEADFTRMKQVVINLLSNAVKYNKENGEIFIVCNFTENNRFKLAFTDTGIGLSDEQQENLFQPFARFNDDNKNIEGTGIGLVITKQLVEMMGGVIGLESKLGEGSTFWIEFSQNDISTDNNVSS
ncbi:MAG: PAS domain-containing protein [Gammaproteobacteria bacterium]|nr:PAS domain-containing protein [Gammaproteobacteria bacterium]